MRTIPRQAGQLSNRFSLTHVRVLPEHSVAQRMASMQAALDALAARVGDQDRVMNANIAEAFSKEEVRQDASRSIPTHLSSESISPTPEARRSSAPALRQPDAHHPTAPTPHRSDAPTLDATF